MSLLPCLVLPPHSPHQQPPTMAHLKTTVHGSEHESSEGLYVDQHAGATVSVSVSVAHSSPPSSTSSAQISSPASASASASLNKEDESACISVPIPVPSSVSMNWRDPHAPLISPPVESVLRCEATSSSCSSRALAESTPVSSDDAQTQTHTHANASHKKRIAQPHRKLRRQPSHASCKNDDDGDDELVGSTSHANAEGHTLLRPGLVQPFPIPFGGNPASLCLSAPAPHRKLTAHCMQSDDDAVQAMQSQFEVGQTDEEDAIQLPNEEEMIRLTMMDDPEATHGSEHKGPHSEKRQADFSQRDPALLASIMAPYQPQSSSPPIGVISATHSPTRSRSQTTMYAARLRRREKLRRRCSRAHSRQRAGRTTAAHTAPQPDGGDTAVATAACRRLSADVSSATDEFDSEVDEEDEKHCTFGQTRRKSVPAISCKRSSVDASHHPLTASPPFDSPNASTPALFQSQTAQPGRSHSKPHSLSVSSSTPSPHQHAPASATGVGEPSLNVHMRHDCQPRPDRGSIG